MLQLFLCDVLDNERVAADLATFQLSHNSVHARCRDAANVTNTLERYFFVMIPTIQVNDDGN